MLAEPLTELIDALKRDGQPPHDWILKHAPEGDLHPVWTACPSATVLLQAHARTGDRAALVRAVCACVRRALQYVPLDEPRPRQAIEAAEAWADGGVDPDAVLATANAADDAASEASDAASSAADASSAAALAAAVVDADGDEEAGERAAQALRYAEDALDHEVVNRLHDLTDIKQERARRDAVFSDVVRAHLRCPTLDRLLGSRPADDPE
ncbi:MAG TPA: hypothetical protein PLB92_12915 [Rhodoglobus sp.]|jgi:hypothetical protein|nr:hypothetical protein [Rhodoglobus sp.]